MSANESPKQNMLVLSTLTALLSQLLSPSLHTAIMLTPPGNLVAYTTDGSPVTRSEDRTRVVIGLASEVWREGTKSASTSAAVANGEPAAGKGESEDDDEDEIGMLECELGRVFVYPIYAAQSKPSADAPPKASGSTTPAKQPALLLALNATEDEPWGLMHTKARALAKYLSEPLASLGDKLIPGTSPDKIRRTGGVVWGR